MPLKIPHDDDDIPTDPFGEPTPVVEDAGEIDIDPPGAQENLDAVSRYRAMWSEAMAEREPGDEVADGLDNNFEQGE